MSWEWLYNVILKMWAISLKGVIETLSALLVPVIGGTTAYIAYQQHKIAKQQHQVLKLKTRLDLFEKRWVIYLKIMGLLGKIGQQAAIDSSDMIQFLKDTKESEFLFEKEVSVHIDEIYKKGIDLDYCDKRLRDHYGLPVGDERSRLAEKQGELLKWFSDQFQVTREKFRPYLDVSELR